VPPSVDKEWEEAKKSLSHARTEFTRYKNAHFMDRKKLEELSGPELGRHWQKLADLHELQLSRSIQLRALTDDPEVLENLDARTDSYQHQYTEICTFLSKDTKRRKFLRNHAGGDEDDVEDEEQEEEEDFHGDDFANNQEDEDDLDEHELRALEARRLEAARKEDERRRQRQALFDQQCVDGNLLDDEFAALEGRAMGSQDNPDLQTGGQRQHSVRGSISSLLLLPWRSVLCSFVEFGVGKTIHVFKKKSGHHSQL